MEHASLTDPVRFFLRALIGTIERLDLLLLMQRRADCWWTSTALADELQIPVDVVESGLESLGAGNLINVRIAQDVLYQFCPGTSELQQFVAALTRACDADRHGLTAMVTRPASIDGKLSADAFRRRKRSRDGQRRQAVALTAKAFASRSPRQCRPAE